MQYYALARNNNTKIKISITDLYIRTNLFTFAK
jgi:hypothetical protein